MAGTEDLLSAGNSLLGGSGGGGTGALSSAASLAGGPAGSVAGAGLNLASSLLQNISANKLKKQAEASLPLAVDPRQASFLAELNQKRKAMDTGADYASAMTEIDSTNAGTRQGILSASGGNTGSAMQALLASQRGADAAKGNVIAQGQAQQMGLNQMFGSLNDKISERVRQLDLLKSMQARAEWAQKKQMANQDMMAGLSGAAGLLSKIKPGGGEGEAGVGSTDGGTFGSETADNVNFDTGGGAPDMGMDAGMDVGIA
jgi:hypothetical protein